MKLQLICHTCGSPYERPAAVAARGSRFCSGPCRVKTVTNANRRPLEERFWEKVIKGRDDECWPWIGGKFADGYGAIRIDRASKRAPRVSYELAKGPIPKGKQVRHECDNPICVNPTHLLVGTHADNMSDMAERSRGHREYRVTDDEVQQIREADDTLANLAAKYGVSIGLIAAIRGKAGHRVKRPVSMSRRREKFS